MTNNPSSKFLKLICSCGNEQVVFGKTATKVKCDSCNKLIAKPSGGKTVILAKVKEVL